MHLLRSLLLWLALLGSAFTMAGGTKRPLPPPTGTGGRFLLPQPQPPPHQRQRINNTQTPLPPIPPHFLHAMARGLYSPPWCNDVFLKQPVEDQLKLAVSWFFEAVNHCIIKPKRVEPSKPEQKGQLNTALKQAEGVVQGVLCHYDYLASSTENRGSVLDREVDVVKKAQSHFEAVKQRHHAVIERTKGRQDVALRTLSFLFGGSAKTTVGQFVAMLYVLNLGTPGPQLPRPPRVKMYWARVKATTAFTCPRC